MHHLTRLPTLILCALALLALVGCDDDTPPATQGDGGPQADMARLCEATGQPITPEICDFRDNDCDGDSDEGFDLTSSVEHCGVCNNACDFGNARVLCVAGECTFNGCPEGLYDADGDPTNGCEGQCDATPGPERCDGRDNDCDGRADEDFALDLDLTNCGACGVICDFERGEALCDGGRCLLVACEPGWGDFDGDPDNGCEARCEVDRPGVDVCDGLDNDCDGVADEGFDLTRDGEHCGQCNARCAFANGAGACRDGACELVGCEAGFVDADGDLENGCEARCAVTNAGVEICDDVDNDCNGVVDDGVDKQTDPENCGGCGALDEAFICRLPNAEVACVAGACAIDRCAPGFADFDRRTDNGCEAVCVASNGGVEACDQQDNDCDGAVDEGFDLAADVRHCGGCGTVCLAGNATPACDAGVCVVGACPDGTVDADRNPRNGCEYQCRPTANPAEICDGQDNDCDGDTDEGFDLFADVATCGACDTPCAPPNAVPVCSGGTCDLIGCAEGWFDANGRADDGCEIECTPSADGFEICDGQDNDCDSRADEDFNLDTDVLHCGGCDQPCSLPNGVVACEAGQCRDVGCAPGWHDLDGERGCEYRCVPADPPIEACSGADDDCDGAIDEGFDTDNSLDHCGACGVTCRSPNGVVDCVAGQCRLIECAPGFVDANADPVDGCELACVPTPGGVEVCDGQDNDCNGLTDEAFDLRSSVEHCGACGNGCAVDNGAPFCNAGACAVLRCDAGYVDVDGAPGNGCECQITQGGVELCDGVDNDCNGIVDDADRVVPPADLSCGGRGVCRGVRPACRQAAWICPYGPTYEADETRCDGLDNDCDGITDEPFPELGTPCAAGVGACGELGTVTCVAADRAACSAEAQPQLAEDETCNGIDDDCDGTVDEDADALVAVPAGGGVAAFRIYAYEASRTDADGQDGGQSFARACSKADALPWVNANYDTARAACAAAGLRLCTAAEWGRACAGASGQAYPYGNVYQPNSCNGHDYDADGLTPGNQDVALPTGSLGLCRRAWGGARIYDLSGNVWEWTSDVPANGARGLRGGSFGNIGGGLTCGFELAQPVAAARENVGFRCCGD